MSALLQTSAGLAAPYLVHSRLERDRTPPPQPARSGDASTTVDSREEARRRDIEAGRRDRELVERLGRGDHQALAELYDCHGGTVYSIALSILRDPGRAEDVTQEVFLTLWTQPDRYDPAVGRFAPWFYRIARNRAIDVLRKLRREVMPDEPAVFDLMLGEAGDSPPETMVQRHDAVRVRSALRKIPAEQRRLIELAYFGGLTQRQMAERCDLPLGTVKTRVRSGLRHLRAILGDA